MLTTYVVFLFLQTCKMIKPSEQRIFVKEEKEILDKFK